MRNGVFAAVAAASLMLLGTPSATGATGSTTVPTINIAAGGLGGPGPATKFSVYSLSVSAGGGYVYVASPAAVYRIKESTDWLSPFAGSLNTDRLGNGLPAGSVTLQVSSTAVDSYGNLLLAEPGIGRPVLEIIRVVAQHTGVFYGQNMTAGRVYTIAGNGKPGYSGDGGPALQAELDGPQSVAVDRVGNVVITDTNNHRIRVVAVKSGNFYGQQMKAGDIYTVFTLDGFFQQAVADRWGNLVVNDPQLQSVYVVAESNGTYYGQPMIAGQHYAIASISDSGAPTGLTVDSAGNVIFGDSGPVQVVAATSGSFYGLSMTAGQVYTIAGGGSSTADGVPATQAAVFAYSVAMDDAGNVLIGDATRKFRVVAVKSGTFYNRAMTAGDIYTFAGNGNSWFSDDGGSGTSAQISDARGTGVDAAGNMIITDYRNFRVRVLAQQTGTYFGQQMTNGDIYTIAGNGLQNQFGSYDGMNALSIPLNGPTGAAVDSNGNVLLADPGQEGYGPVAVIAEQTGTFYGRQMTAGDIYELSTGQAEAVHLDHNKNLVIAAGHAVNVFAVQNGLFYQQQMTADHVYQVAGGGPFSTTAVNGIPATQAYISGAAETVVDAAGNLVIADSGYNMIRVVAATSGTFYGQAMKAGYIYDVAGTGAAGPGKNGIPALQAQLYSPRGVAVDAAGNLVICDSKDNEIRVVATKAGTYYGQPMKAGDIYVIAGTGRYAIDGLGGPASKASLRFPEAVRILPGGDILVSEGDVLLKISG